MNFCKDCQFFNVSDTWEDCAYHSIDTEPDNSCDNFAKQEDGKPRDELATFVAEAVVGSCDFHGQYRQIMDIFTDEEWGTFDNITFECACCGWWCETGDEDDYYGERYCSECYKDHFSYCDDCGSQLDEFNSSGLCADCEESEED